LKVYSIFKEFETTMKRNNKQLFISYRKSTNLRITIIT